MHENRKTVRFDTFIICLVFAFAAGSIFTGLFLSRNGSHVIAKLNRQYAVENGRAADIIGNLTEELKRERELNRELREYNNQARTIAGRITDSTEYNVRNLHEAIGLIGEVREKLKVLADIYPDSDTGNSPN